MREDMRTVACVRSFYECFDIIHGFEAKWALLVSVPWGLAAMKLGQWGLGIGLLRAGGKFRRWSWINESNRISIRNEYVADSIYAFFSTMIPCAGWHCIPLPGQGRSGVIWWFCAAKAISIFSCRPIFDDVRDASAGSYLASDPSILCWEGTHIYLCGLAAPFVLFYLICMPASVAYVLLRSGANGVRHSCKEYKVCTIFG